MDDRSTQPNTVQVQSNALCVEIQHPKVKFTTTAGSRIYNPCVLVNYEKYKPFKSIWPQEQTTRTCPVCPQSTITVYYTFGPPPCPSTTVAAAAVRWLTGRLLDDSREDIKFCCFCSSRGHNFVLCLSTTTAAVQLLAIQPANRAPRIQILISLALNSISISLLLLENLSVGDSPLLNHVWISKERHGVRSSVQCQCQSLYGYISPSYFVATKAEFLWPNL